MNRLLAGYRQFREIAFPKNKELFQDLGKGQNPHTLFITCADSRVVPNMIVQAEPGDIFTVRNVGNIVPAYGEIMGGVSSAIEYAVMALGVKNIIILGHSDCGAMKALLHPEAVSEMKAVSTWLMQAKAAKEIVYEMAPHAHGEELLRSVTEENVLVQISHLKTHPSVAARLRRGELELHGWVFDIATGECRAWNEAQRRFESLAAMATEAEAVPETPVCA
jgi:carbonic anhydrase